jgi:hypothetical protein
MAMPSFPLEDHANAGVAEDRFGVKTAAVIASSSQKKAR